MVLNLSGLFERYEAFLRVGGNGRIEDVVRCRVIYGAGWGFCLIQLLNLCGMTWTYGQWTLDHSISVGVIFSIILAIHCLRFTHDYNLFAAFYTILCAAGLLFSTVPDGTGVHTALLPLLIFIPMLSAFIAGPKMTVVSGASSALMLLVLYETTMANPTGSAIFDNRVEQRTLQAFYYLVFVTGVAVVFSMTIFRALGKLEGTVLRAKKAEHAKSEFLATMSHELRTPLNGVLGLTQALRNTNLDTEQQNLLQTIDLSGRSLLTILNDILDLSKIEASKFDVVERAFDPAALVHEVVKTWDQSAIQKKLVLEPEISDTLPELLWGDDLRIRQIISNYVSNAIKFTDTGFVRLKVNYVNGTEGSELTICVSDTGMGMPEHVVSKIFSPFEQADNGIARQYGGTGLGLSICKKLAIMMGGDVWVSSVRGTGSSFYLKLPARKVEPTSEVKVSKQESTPQEFSQSCVQGLHILLVEDNLINQMVMDKLLSSLGISHRLAQNGKECLAMLTEDKFDLILMDKHMPIMDGLTATKKIRQLDHPVKDIPIIACTADAMTGESELLLSSGFSSFLSKPVRIEDLKDALAQALDLKSAA